MKEKRSFWIVGGDLRQIKLAELLLEDMRRVATEAVDGMSAKKRRDEGDVCRTVRSAVSSYLYKHTKRSPMVIPVVTRL